jgi:hypothetical protein
MADENARAKELQAKGAELKAESVKEAYAHQGHPTPTQAENDLAALGVTFESHEDDGSGPSPEPRLVIHRQAESGKPGAGYATRSAAQTEQQAQPPRKT